MPIPVSDRIEEDVENIKIEMSSYGTLGVH